MEHCWTELIQNEEEGQECTFCPLDCSIFLPTLRLVHERAHIREYHCQDCNFMAKVAFSAQSHMETSGHTVSQTFLRHPVALPDGLPLRPRWRRSPEPDAGLLVEYQHRSWGRPIRALRFPTPSSDVQYQLPVFRADPPENAQLPRPEPRFQARVQVNPVEVPRVHEASNSPRQPRRRPTRSETPDLDELRPGLRQRAIDLAVAAVHLLFDIWQQ